MRKKLLVIIALGSALAVVAAGTASSVSVGAGYVTATAPADGPSVVPECADLVDNDNDGRVDLADPGCSSPADNDESDDPTGPVTTTTGSTTSTPSTTTTGTGSTTTTGKKGKPGSKVK